MALKQGNQVPYELKPRNMKYVEMLLARYKRKEFLHPIVTGGEKWIHYDCPKRKS